MELYEKLVELRKRSGLSQAEVAESMNISRQAISRWECGAATPSSENLLRIRKLYGVSVDELVMHAVETNQQPPENKRNPLLMPLVAAGCVILILVAAIIGLSLQKEEFITGTSDMESEVVDTENAESFGIQW